MAGPDELTDAFVLARVETECKYKNTTGGLLLARLTSIAESDSLARVMQNPDEFAWKLRNRFRSPLLLQQHVQSVVTAVRYMGKRLSPACLDRWISLLAEVKSMQRERQIAVQAYFTNVTSDATPTTVAGYVNHIMNMCALLNVANFVDVVISPSGHRIVYNDTHACTIFM